MSAVSQPVVTADDFSSLPTVIGLFLAVTSVLFVVTKIITKLSMTRSFGIDDASIFIALVSSLGMVTAISIQAANGLGKKQISLSEAQLTIFEKTAYATDFLYITTLFFSKSTLVLLLRGLTPVRSHQLLTYVLAGALGSWALSGLFTIAFQCSTPQMWAVVTGNCMNQTSFWIYFGILNIISEVSLVLLPAFIMQSVQIPRRKKTVIMLVFALRIFVVAAIIPELIFRIRASQAPDRTFAPWPFVLCTLFVQCLSIIFACVPYLRPFFGALESGMIRMDDTRRREGRTTRSGGVSYKKSKESVGHARGRGHNSSKPMTGNSSDAARNWTQVSGGVHLVERSLWDTDGESQRSDAGLIRATTTFEVLRED